MCAGITDPVRKFYGKFNSIMSVLGRWSSENTARHLVKAYCLPALLYGCETWHLNETSIRFLSVAWSDCLRNIFVLLERKCKTITVFLFYSSAAIFTSSTNIKLHLSPKPVTIIFVNFAVSVLTSIRQLPVPLIPLSPTPNLISVIPSTINSLCLCYPASSRSRTLLFVLLLKLLSPVISLYTLSLLAQDH